MIIVTDHKPLLGILTKRNSTISCFEITIIPWNTKQRHLIVILVFPIDFLKTVKMTSQN